MNRRLLSTILTLMVGTLSLLAKPGVPLQFQLEKTGVENLGEITRYTVDLSLTPLADSDLISLDVKVPLDYQLLNGFKYWEGKIDARNTFSEQLVFDGPTTNPLDLEIHATMHLGKALSSKVLKLRLSPEAELSKAVYPKLQLELQKASSDEERRVRRQ